MKWSEMTPTQQAQTSRAMAQFGGSFVVSLARTWRLADQENSMVLMSSFPDVVATYGPGTAFYNGATLSLSLPEARALQKSAAP